MMLSNTVVSHARLGRGRKEAGGLVFGLLFPRPPQFSAAGRTPAISRSASAPAGRTKCSMRGCALLYFLQLGTVTRPNCSAVSLPWGSSDLCRGTIATCSSSSTLGREAWRSTLACLAVLRLAARRSRLRHCPRVACPRFTHVACAAGGAANSLAPSCQMEGRRYLVGLIEHPRCGWKVASHFPRPRPLFDGPEVGPHNTYADLLN